MLRFPSYRQKHRASSCVLVVEDEKDKQSLPYSVSALFNPCFFRPKQRKGSFTSFFYPVMLLLHSSLFFFLFLFLFFHFSSVSIILFLLFLPYSYSSQDVSLSCIDKNLCPLERPFLFLFPSIYFLLVFPVSLPSVSLLVLLGSKVSLLLLPLFLVSVPLFVVPSTQVLSSLHHLFPASHFTTRKNDEVFIEAWLTINSCHWSSCKQIG